MLTIPNFLNWRVLDLGGANNRLSRHDTAGDCPGGGRHGVRCSMPMEAIAANGLF